MILLLPFVLPIQIGIAVMTWTFWLCMRFLYFHFWPNMTPLETYKSEEPLERTWAMITGSTGGIGLGFAEELVTRGFGVILLARNKDKLAATEAHLKTLQEDAEVKTIVCELTNFRTKDLEKVVKCISNLPVTILINNVGRVPTMPTYKPFSDFTVDDIDNAVNLNARLMAHLTRLMIPVLLTRTNSRSLIINMSSGARFGVPFLASYAATKSFNTTFSAVLSREFTCFGLPIDCVSILAGDVRSQSNTTQHGRNAPSSREYAQMTLDRVDRAVSRGLTEFSPFWMHNLAFSVQSLLPEWLQTRFVNHVIKGRLESQEKGE